LLKTGNFGENRAEEFERGGKKPWGICRGSHEREENN